MRLSAFRNRWYGRPKNPRARHSYRELKAFDVGSSRSDKKMERNFVEQIGI